MSTMTTSVHQPRGALGDATASTRRNAVVTSVLLAVCAAVVAVAGLVAWPLLSGNDGAGGTQLEVKGGVVRFEGLKPEVLAHAPGMPGQMMPQPVPAGFRRISVEVSLVATGSGMTYDAADFRLAAPDAKAVPPQRDALGTGVVPEGSRVNGELVFLAPEDARALSLTVRGVDGSIAVDAPPAPEHSEGHSG
jgi:hypothetical protein